MDGPKFWWLPWFPAYSWYAYTFVTVYIIQTWYNLLFFSIKKFNTMCHNWPTFFTRVWFSANRVAKIDGSIILTDNCNCVLCKVTTYICTLYLSTFMKSLGHLLLFYLTVLLNKKTKLQPSAIPEHNLDGIPVGKPDDFSHENQKFLFLRLLLQPKSL